MEVGRMRLRNRPQMRSNAYKVTHSACDSMLEATRTRIAAEIETLGEIRHLLRLAERTLELLREQTLSG